MRADFSAQRGAGGAGWAASAILVCRERSGLQREVSISFDQLDRCGVNYRDHSSDAMGKYRKGRSSEITDVMPLMSERQGERANIQNGIGVSGEGGRQGITTGEITQRYGQRV